MQLWRRQQIDPSDAEGGVGRMMAGDRARRMGGGGGEDGGGEDGGGDDVDRVSSKTSAMGGGEGWRWGVAGARERGRSASVRGDERHVCVLPDARV